jgi:serine/threonine-protein kinase
MEAEPSPSIRPAEERGPLKVIGRYALYSELATGGMATVYLGRLLGPVGFSRTVAIKRLHQQFAKDPEFTTGFLDEARLAARIRHPNVVPTLDVVALDGELFLVMEYVQGESLSYLARRVSKNKERVPVPIAASVISGVLQGLHAAHEARSERGDALGIVHRDVSPQNILVGVDGVPRVLDFGVAKAIGRLQSTREGQIKGKLAYMAPEQVTAGPVSRQSDLFAASIVLWELLAGRRLFRGDNEAETLYNVLQGIIQPPSKYAPGIPAAIDAVVMRGLERDRSKRYTTAREMAVELEKAAPIVSAREVGEWVERVAREKLESRAAQIAEIEMVSLHTVHPASQPPAGGALHSNAAVSPPPHGSEDSLADLASGTSGGSSRTLSRMGSAAQRRSLLAAAGGAVALAVIVMLWIMLSPSEPAPAVPKAAMSSASPAPPIVTAAASQAPDPVEAPSDTHTVAAAPDAATPPAVELTEPPRPTQRRTARPRPRPPPPKEQPRGGLYSRE